MPLIWPLPLLQPVLAYAGHPSATRTGATLASASDATRTTTSAPGATTSASGATRATLPPLLTQPSPFWHHPRPTPCTPLSRAMSTDAPLACVRPPSLLFPVVLCCSLMADVLPAPGRPEVVYDWPPTPPKPQAPSLVVLGPTLPLGPVETDQVKRPLSPGGMLVPPPKRVKAYVQRSIKEFTVRKPGVMPFVQAHPLGEQQQVVLTQILVGENVFYTGLAGA